MTVKKCSRRPAAIANHPLNRIGALGTHMPPIHGSVVPTSVLIRKVARASLTVRPVVALIGKAVLPSRGGSQRISDTLRLKRYIGITLSVLGACLPVTAAMGTTVPNIAMSPSQPDETVSFRDQAPPRRKLEALKTTLLVGDNTSQETINPIFDKNGLSVGSELAANDATAPSTPAANPQTTGGMPDGASRPESSTQGFSGQSDATNKRVSFAPGVSSSPGPDADPNQLLALFRDGSGQTVASLDEIDAVMRQDQVFSDIRTLQDRITDSQRPVANLVGRHSNQSDHLDITQTEASLDVYLDQGRLQARLGFQDVEYRAPNVQGISEYSPGFTANARINDVSSIAGEFWLNRIDYGRAQATVPTYDVFLTVRPTDFIRIDIDTNRRTFDNILSLALGITAQTFGGSIDVMPVDGVKVTLRGSGASYSDHNNRRSEEVEGIWRLRTNPIIFELGLRGTNFHYTRLLADGYFNPDNYYSGELLFRVQSTFSKKLVVEVAGSGGVENADPGGTKPLIKGSLQAVYKLSNGWSVEGEAAHFSSRESSSSGFSRTSFTAGLHYRF